MTSDEQQMAVFLDVQRGLPRQGPGSADSTKQALALCAGLPSDPTLLDIGCGPGAQTMVLAANLLGRIIAVDTCQEYLDVLLDRAAQAEVADRVEILNADMAALDLPSGSIDIIWCEAAAYAMGIPAALKAWRPLLREGGYLVFSELVWLQDDAPATVREFWASEYPAMTEVDTVLKWIDSTGYRRVGDFTLPDEAWWIDYYGPLEAKLPGLRQKYADDERALSVVEATQTEIEMRRSYPTYYGYHFFVTRVLSGP